MFPKGGCCAGNVRERGRVRDSRFRDLGDTLLKLCLGGRVRRILRNLLRQGTSSSVWIRFCRAAVSGGADFDCNAMLRFALAA